MGKNKLLVIIIILITSCVEENDDVIDNSSLFLRVAEVDEKIIVKTQEGEYRFPADILFRVSSRNRVEVLNYSQFKIKSYKMLSFDQAIFEVVTDTISDQTTQMNAQILPFSKNDYGEQTDIGEGIFNGIIKGNNFILAVNTTATGTANFKFFNLENKKLTQNIASIKNGALFFKIENDIWQIWRTNITPKGNLFQYYTPNAESTKQGLCYTLSKESF